MADERARALRKRMTPREVKLWVKLRELKAQGLHFRRQAPRGKFIVDFACLAKKVLIEVDGSQHGEDANRRHDAIRDAALSSKGFAVLRFWNNEIDRNLDGVVETIFAACSRQERPSASAPPVSPLRGDPPSPAWRGRDNAAAGAGDKRQPRHTAVRCRAMQVARTSSMGRSHQRREKISTSA